MPEPQNTIPPALERWLFTATYDLAENARARVRAEVATHFADAVAAALAEGKSRAAAEAVAVAALGNRFDAQILMARSNLTATEERYLKAILGATREPINPRLLAWGWISLLPPLLLFLIHDPVWLRLLLLFVIFFAALPFVMEIRKLALRSRASGLAAQVRAALFRENLILTALMLWFWLYWFLLSRGSPFLHNTSLSILLQFLFMGLFRHFYTRRLIRKLGGWQALEALETAERNGAPQA
jgi:hypothetical protein